VLFSSGVSWMPIALAVALLVVGGAWARQRAVPAPFWILGFGVVWWLSVAGGLSTSLIAVAFAVIVPINPRGPECQSPLKDAMHDLHPYVAYCVLPIFAFAKAGVSFTGITAEQALAPLVVGIAAGLFVGKQLGVFGFAWLATRLGWGARPTNASWAQLYGVALLCGVGFTMSLFIGALAFPGAIDSPEQVEVKIGVLAGSILSAVVGAIVLALAKRSDVAEEDDPDLN
jgi:NhaA family Na+:H+ antiporter